MRRCVVVSTINSLKMLVEWVCNRRRRNTSINLLKEREARGPERTLYATVTHSIDLFSAFGLVAQSWNFLCWWCGFCVNPLRTLYCYCFHPFCTLQLFKQAQVLSASPSNIWSIRDRTFLRKIEFMGAAPCPFLDSLLKRSLIALKVLNYWDLEYNLTK